MIAARCCALLILAGLPGLAGCSPTSEQAPPAPASPPVPATIERLSRTAFAADGEIHVQQRGRIVITPTTPACYYVDGVNWFFVESEPLFGALGQSATIMDGTTRRNRQRQASESSCDPRPDVVLTRGVRLPNRNGTPYKLVLAVWQGDVDGGAGAYWVGAVERLDGRRPEIADFPPYRVGPEARARVSTEIDIGALSEAFINSFGMAGAE